MQRLAGRNNVINNADAFASDFIGIHTIQIQVLFTGGCDRMYGSGRNGLVTAVTTMVVPPTAALLDSAVGASSTTVLKIPSTNRKPAMDEDGTYLLIFGRTPVSKITPIIAIMATPAHTGWGALAVAES